MKVLVTGAAGFVGSHLCETLLRAGHSVTAIDRFSDYYDPLIKQANVLTMRDWGAEIISADLVDIDLHTLLENHSHVVHLAGQPGVRPSWGSSFGLYLRDNVMATQRLLEAVRNVDSIERFVYASSSSVYGDAESYPTTEETLTLPRSPYGVTKLAGENLTTLYSKNFGVPGISLRFFTVYGPRQRPDMAFHRLLRALLREEEFTVFGDGSQIREFTYVDDITNAISQALLVETPVGSIVNLSGGTSVSLTEAIQVAERATGRKLRANYEAPAHGDVFRTGGSTQLAQQLLGWSPRVPIEEGLVAEAQWVEGALREGLI